jgi:TonB family protein
VEIMSRSKISLSFLAILVCGASIPLRSRAQTSPNEAEIDKPATRTAERVAKTQAHHVLVLTVQGCLLDPDLCGSLDQKLRVELQMAIPGVQLLTRRDVVPLLPKYGLLPVDAYTIAVEATAPDLGAEAMVTESLAAIEGGYQAIVTVMDLNKHQNLDEFRAKLDEPASDSATGPVIFREPEDGPAVVVPRPGPNPAGKGSIFASCQQCLEPSYTPEARAKKIAGVVLLVATITDQGTAERIAVIRGLGSGLTESAVRAVRGWRFKPAIGPDGKPFATRTPIEVNFILKP